MKRFLRSFLNRRTERTEAMSPATKAPHHPARQPQNTDQSWRIGKNPKTIEFVIQAEDVIPIMDAKTMGDDIRRLQRTIEQLKSGERVVMESITIDQFLDGNFEFPTRTEVIARRAYQIYESQGRPDGRDVDHWNQAEREIFPAHETKVELG